MYDESEESSTDERVRLALYEEEIAQKRYVDMVLLGCPCLFTYVYFQKSYCHKVK